MGFRQPKKTPERHKKMNRNGVPVAKRRTGTLFRCVPVHFEPCQTVTKMYNSPKASITLPDPAQLNSPQLN
jgi:hypothetical protein